MICPKCSQEMGSEQLRCNFCGFTFRTPGTRDTAIDSAALPGVQQPMPYAPAALPPQRPVMDTGYRPAQNPHAAAVFHKPLGVCQYIGMLLLSLIPLVGLIVFIVWLCNPSGNPYRRTFAKAMVILNSTLLCFFLGATIMFSLFHTTLFFLPW